MIDRKNNVPFGTLGYTEYNSQKREHELARALIGDIRYRNSLCSTEAYLLIQDYLYYGLNTNISYSYVLDNNYAVHLLHRDWGYKQNFGNAIKYPERTMRNDKHLLEFVRGIDQYEIARENVVKIMNILSEK